VGGRDLLVVSALRFRVVELVAQSGCHDKIDHLLDCQIGWILEIAVNNARCLLGALGGYFVTLCAHKSQYRLE